MKCCRWRIIFGDKPVVDGAGSRGSLRWRVGIAWLAVLTLLLTAAKAAAPAMPQEPILLSRPELTRLVERYLMDHLPWGKPQVKITNLQIQGDLQVPQGQLSYEVLPYSRQLWLGPVSLAVVVRVDGRAVRRLLATGRVDVMARVVVAAHPLAAQQPITDADIHLEERNLAHVPEGAATDPREVVGKRTRRGIGAGSVLQTRLLEAPPLIKRGAIVTILAESPRIKVIAQGQAKEDGVHGGQIRILNLSSHKEIYAKVVDESTVRVDF